MDLSSKPKERRLVALGDVEENPYQMRAFYDESTLMALATSIQEVGLIHPPIARRLGEDRYQLAAGHRRLKAFARLARSGFLQYQQIPIDVMDLSDQEMLEVSLSENLKRADLSPLEKAAALKEYLDSFGATCVQAATLFGIPESTIRGTVRLLNLPEEAQEQLRTGKLSQHQARKILEKPETQQKRVQRREQHFDLREQLIILLYDHMRYDITDQLLYKKVKTLVETNQQLEHQVELMNSRQRERGRLHHAGARV